MRAEVEHHLLLATPKHHGVGESGATRDDLDGAATGVVQTPPLEEPSIRIPGPIGHGAVYDCGPKPDEDHHGDQTTAFCYTAHDNGSRDGTELHLARGCEPTSLLARWLCTVRAYLVERIQQFGNQRAAGAGMRKYTLQAKLIQVSDEAIGGWTKSERVSPKVPLKGDDRGREHAGPDEGEGRLSASKTRV